MVLKKKIISITIVIIITLGIGLFVIVNKEPRELTYLSISTKPFYPKKRPLYNSLPICILPNKNFFESSLAFKIEADSVIYIEAIGEGGNHLTNPYIFKSFNNDGIELFFDMKNQKTKNFNLKSDDRQYRFLWKLLTIDGQNINTKGIKLIEKDPTYESYILEISIPWKSLGFIKPQEGVKIGFDIALIDKNLTNGQALLNWHSKYQDTWCNTSRFGTLFLTKSKMTSSDSVAYCKYVSLKSKSISTIDSIWTKTESNKIKNISLRSIEDSLDLSGNFKTLWDEENLYVFVNVHDDVKEYENAMFDYGWIEDSNGKIIWQMLMPETTHAGGALKNRQISKTLKLKKGNYMLKYKTDESHSPNQWDAKPPSTPFYGIKIKYAK